MNKLSKAIKILNDYGFNFTDSEREANIIIRTPQEIVGNKAIYKIIRASHNCKTQIQFVSLTLLDLFEEKEDRKFLERFNFESFEGKLGENDFLVRTC